MERLAEHFRAMARNNAWANARLIDACAALSAEEYAAPRTNFFPSIRATLNHLHMVDLFYVGALEGSGRGHAGRAEAPDFPDAGALRPAQAAVDARLIAFCDALSDESCDRTAPTDRGEAGIVPERVGMLLAHLFQHQIHHRGQAHAMLAGTRVPPPQLDEYFLEFERHPSVAAMGLLATGMGARG